MSQTVPTDSGAPVEGLSLAPATEADAAELLVLQRCCWVQEALANSTLDIPALHESLEDVRTWLADWETWAVRLDSRLVAGVRARATGDVWEIGRLMVAPDLSGHGIGRWLLAHAERRAPDATTSFALTTGADSARNLALYRRAGYRPAPKAEDSAGTVRLHKPAGQQKT